MRNLIVFSLLVVAVMLSHPGLLLAQQLPGHDVVTEGMMPNNDQVPGVYTLETAFDRGGH